MTEDGDRPPWAYLDLLQREPFFASYKERVRELLSPQPGERHLDVGGGTGDDARAIEDVCGFAAMLELRRTHALEARSRGLDSALVGDGRALPFGDATFDTCVLDRVLQHVDAPAAIVDELARVLRGGGRIVTIDPDLDTQVIALDATDVARRVFRYRADVARPSGTVARRTASLLRRARFERISVEARTLIVRDPSRVDNVMGLKHWARFAHEAGAISADEAAEWPRMIDAAAAAGDFLYAVTYFITYGARTWNSMR